MAVGYLLLNLFSSSGNLSGDVCSTLFGSTSILTLSTTEVWLCIGLSVVVLAIFVFFYNKIFAVTFDENFAHSCGTRVERYNLLIAVVIAVIIVLAMNLVGSLLISALIIFPAMSAMRVFRSFKSVTVCSAALSVVCAVVGILAHILLVGRLGAVGSALVLLVYEVRQRRNFLRDAGRWVSVLSPTISAYLSLAAGAILLLFSSLPPAKASMQAVARFLPVEACYLGTALCALAGCVLVFLPYGLIRRQLRSWRLAMGCLALGVYVHSVHRVDKIIFSGFCIGKTAQTVIL